MNINQIKNFFIKFPSCM